MRWILFAIPLSMAAPGCRMQSKNVRDPIRSSKRPASFLEQKLVGNRLISEMQSNWKQSDTLHVHRIVLKGFLNSP